MEPKPRVHRAPTTVAEWVEEEPIYVDEPATEQAEEEIVTMICS
jgi:hypothetical protein